MRVRALVSLRTCCISTTWAISRSPKPWISKARQRYCEERPLSSKRDLKSHIFRARLRYHHASLKKSIAPPPVVTCWWRQWLSQASWDTHTSRSPVNRRFDGHLADWDIPGKAISVNGWKEMSMIPPQKPSKQCRVPHKIFALVSSFCGRVEGLINKNKREWQVAIKERRLTTVAGISSFNDVLCATFCSADFITSFVLFPRSRRNQSEEAVIQWFLNSFP